MLGYGINQSPSNETERKVAWWTLLITNYSPGVCKFDVDKKDAHSKRKKKKNPREFHRSYKAIRTIERHAISDIWSKARCPMVSLDSKYLVNKRFFEPAHRHVPALHENIYSTHRENICLP